MKSWLTPSADLDCLPGEVHLWRIPLGMDLFDYPSVTTLLDEKECLRANRFYFSHDKAYYTAAHIALRLILTRYTGLPPGQILYECDGMGKPHLTDKTGLHFNLSHSGNLGLVGICRDHEIGVDLECIRSVKSLNLVAMNFFTLGETEALNALPPRDLLKGFFNCWTRKEAFIKLTGQGVSFPLDQFEVRLAPGKPAGLVKLFGSEIPAKDWTIMDIPYGRSVAAAVAIAKDTWRLRLWQFNLQTELKLACDKWGELFVVHNRTA
jgi:4'-phosphopantetheinyl transferase